MNRINLTTTALALSACLLAVSCVTNQNLHQNNRRRLETTETAPAAAVKSADWPVWGRDGTRNMVSDETGAPTEWEIGEMDENEVVDMSLPKGSSGWPRLVPKPMATSLLKWKSSNRHEQ